jgi:hypothetical protein
MDFQTVLAWIVGIVLLLVCGGLGWLLWAVIPNVIVSWIVWAFFIAVGLVVGFFGWGVVKTFTVQ